MNNILFTVPDGWTKGEPLVVRRISDTCFTLQRSGSYLQAPYGPAAKVKNAAHALQFTSRAEMAAFQAWWDAPPSVERPVELTRHEYLEYVQEALNFAPSRFSGVLESIVPRAAGLGDKGSLESGLCYRGCTEQEAKDLRQAHSDYCQRVGEILGFENNDG